MGLAVSFGREDEAAAAAAKSVDAEDWKAEVDCLYAKCGIREDVELEVVIGSEGPNSGDAGDP